MGSLGFFPAVSAFPWCDSLPTILDGQSEGFTPDECAKFVLKNAAKDRIDRNHCNR
jgi:hypothetical protein